MGGSSESESESDGSALRLSWRDDPSDTFSDFAIVVGLEAADCEDRGGKIGEKTYHVHKAIVAVGIRRSKYFERLFKNGGYQENSSNSVHFRRKQWEAEAFPWMLDYQYNQQHSFEFTIRNSVPLFSFADYFDIPRLRKDARAFWKRNLCPANCHIYYDKAKLCGNNSALNAVEWMCIRRSREVIQNSSLFRSTTPDFWLPVFQNLAKVSCRDGGTLNGICTELIEALVAEKAPEDFEVETFRSLTDASCIPALGSVNTAFTLLQLDNHFLADSEAPFRPGELSCLQRRCLEALKSALSNEASLKSRAASQSEILERLRTANPRLVEIFLMDVIEIERSQNAELPSRVTDLTKSLKSKEAEIVQLKVAIKSKEAQIAALTVHLNAMG
jgi:hypothetical protein